MKPRLIFISIVIAFIAILQRPWRHDAVAADPPAPAAVAVALVPGLSLSFQNAKGETVDAREVRLIALTVPAGSPASPAVEPGAFTAVWSGVIVTKIKDTYRFAAEGRGDLTVTINEKTVLELHGDFARPPTGEIPIKKGKNRIVATYHSPADGDANIRLLWAASGRPIEPMSPAIFSHDAAADVFAQHASLRMGRELVATMRCSACHQGVTGSMPELKQDAPNLADVKTRLNVDWIAYWITNPKSLRATATMPRVFHDQPASAQPSADQRAVDIAAYLGGVPDPVMAPPPPPSNDPAVLARGARLFTGLGCVACHAAPGIEDSDPTLNRVPLKFVRAKFQNAQLKAFLLKPETHYAWIKMPNFHLSDTEASAISAWLLSQCKDDALPPITLKSDAANGKKLFESMGCMSCHATGNSPSAAASAVALTGAGSGCLADDLKNQKGVDYSFTAEQRTAIRAFLATDWKPQLARDPLPEFTARQMTALRCTACHSMDGRDNTWSQVDTDISTIEQNLPERSADDPEPKGDQTRPPLTWTGEKLQPSWMTAFLQGKIPYKPRPWVLARMPAFASRAELLSQGLALSHGFTATDDVRPPADENLADVGKQLTALAAPGLGCVNCHSVANQPANAPFQADAPNFAHVDARIRHSYFTRWMNNPQYYLPGTKMPTFTQADGTTAIKEILNGDAAAQYEALWNYLRAGEKIVPNQ